MLQFRRIDCETRQYCDIVDDLRDGDLILFKAFDNLYSLVHGSYFGHIGMVARINGVPHLFEANSVTGMNLLPHHSRTGIFLTPLYERIAKYRGYCYVRHLNKELTWRHRHSLLSFIQYALDNMCYDDAVMRSGLECFLGRRCNKKTNCGQVLFLALIAMGLLPFDYYKKNILHHLLYVSRIQKLCDDYEYLDVTRIVDQPFAY